MSNNVTGVKISQFNVSSTISDSAVIPFVFNGTNLVITYANFKNSLGVTGQIKSSGAATSVSILDKPSSGLNYIRGIEPSQGITAQVSPQGGISLKTNFSNAAGGDAEIVSDTTAAQIKFKSLVAGDGLQIEQTTDNITLSTTTATASTKTVIVETIEDFPTAVGGVITLNSDTDYFLSDDITTSNRFTTPTGGAVVIRSADAKIVTLTYTGSGDMFSGDAPNIVLKDVRLVTPNGTLLEYASATSGAISIRNCRLSADTLGNIGSIDNFFISETFVESIVTNGFALSGSGISLSVNDAFVASMTAGTLFDLGSAVFDRFNVSGVTVASSGAATKFLDGLASSGNIAIGTLAQIEGITLSGSITDLTGISSDDARYSFRQCNTIPTTRPDCLLSFSTPTTTAISAVDTPAKVTGTWVSERQSQMTGSTNGRITYNGERGATLPITLSIGMEPVSGSNKNIAVYLFKNGVEVTNSEVNTVSSSGDPKNQTIVWQDRWEQDDYYEVYVENHTDAIDIQVNNAVFRVD